MSASAYSDSEIEAACEWAGVDPVYNRAVRALLEKPRSHWASCCYSGCDPCVKALQRAATRVMNEQDRGQ